MSAGHWSRRLPLCADPPVLDSLLSPYGQSLKPILTHFYFISTAEDSWNNTSEISTTEAKRGEKETVHDYDGGKQNLIVL